MPTEDAAIDEIKALEDRRYRAMIAGDTAVLDELCSDDLIYTHSKADYDDKPSYLHKVGSRYFTYLEITHPADRILVVGGAALVTGRMTAKVLVAGTIVHVDNRYLAVWVREHGAWKFVAYRRRRSSTAKSHCRADLAPRRGRSDAPQAAVDKKATQARPSRYLPPRSSASGTPSPASSPRRWRALERDVGNYVFAE